ncbi:AraC-like DNA-binding protein [Kaistia dalseonensis]|uniref:AraC-like DNA-binding protein n=2 Tax=Kaistia dalseonensis TaxID=410840 RepID=A0ABU0HES2_9HYPH|nr:AraC-like DNA-binding protein [Kaistia dalseonensis]
MKTVSLSRGRHTLHTMPTSTGYETTSSPAYSWNGMKRGETPFTVLQHTVAGRGQLLYERRHHILGAGETMLVIVPHSHRYWVEPGDEWEYFWISMYGQEALRIHRTILALAGPVFRLRPDTVERIAACCLALIDGRGETPGKASALAYEAAMALYDDVLGPHAFGRDPAHGDVIAGIVGHIRANLDGDLDVDRLARLAGFSRAHFSRLFAASEGLSPAEFVTAQRMRRAARLLELGELSIKAISLACGFQDPNYFAKAFRRAYGTSPTEFRTTGMYTVQRNGPHDDVAAPRRD